MKHLLLFSVLWLLTVERSIAIKCYECQSVTDNRCSDHFKLPFLEAIVNCDLEPHPMGLNYRATFCRKIKQKIYDHVRITRSCGFIHSNSTKNCTTSTLTDSTSSQYCDCYDELCNKGRRSVTACNYLLLLISTLISTLSLFAVITKNT